MFSFKTHLISPDQALPGREAVGLDDDRRAALAELGADVLRPDRALATLRAGRTANPRALDILKTADLKSPATTVALIKLDAVVGIVGKVENVQGRDRLTVHDPQALHNYVY